MIKIPRVHMDKVFDSKLSRGVVVRTKIPFEDGGEDYKRLVCVNLDCKADEIYFLTSTSKLDIYKKNPSFCSDIVFVKAGQTDAFDRLTAIKLRKVFSFQRNVLMQRFYEKDFDFLDPVSPKIMSAIDEKLRNSRLIERRIKKLICPGLV